MKRVVRRVNVAFMGGVSLEPLQFDPGRGRNIAIGVYAEGWRHWHFVNERAEVDPERDPQFYYDLAVQILAERGLDP